MKKILTFFVILVCTGVLILLSISKNPSDTGKKGTPTDFSLGEKLYGYKKDKEIFEEIGLSGSKSPYDSYYYRLSPVDGIYYRSDTKNPVQIQKKGDTKVITFGSGVYIFNLVSDLEKYEIHFSDVNMSPNGKGVFLIDTSRGQSTVFSFDSFLSMKLGNSSKSREGISFTLFPSLFFQHDGANTSRLVDADILRISFIDTVQYIDIKNPRAIWKIFSWKNEKDIEFFLSAQKDIVSRIKSFLSFYKEIQDIDINKIKGDITIDPSNILFMNSTKKEIILKNLLLKQIFWLIKEGKSSPNSDIGSTFTEIKEMNAKFYEETKELITRYYFIALFSRFLQDDEVSLLNGKTSIFLSQAQNILWLRPTKQEDYYEHFSNLFSAHYFSQTSQIDLNTVFEKNLQKILSSKVLKKDEFLPLSFFVTQYLSNGTTVPNEVTMRIVLHLFSITNDYYDTIKDNTKISAMLSTTFYNYNKIFTRINRVFSETFLESSPKWIILKQEYTNGTNAVFSQDFLTTFKDLLDLSDRDIQAKKQKFYTLGPVVQDSGVHDNYTLLVSTLKYSREDLLNIFSNYGEYLKNLDLSEKSKITKGLLVETKEDMSVARLGEYLSEFRGVDIDSLQVSNDFKKDGFYTVSVAIYGNTFAFKMWSEGHVIDEISYTDPLFKKHSFPNITIVLDDKKEQFQERFESEEDTEKKYRYDIKNYFEVTFLKENTWISAESTETENPHPTVSPEKQMSTEMQMFVQNELIEKDFKNIVNSFPIGFKNIYATIDNGNYVIELSSINKSFQGRNDPYITEFSGKYIFSRHAFFNLSLRVKMTDGDGKEELLFNGTKIGILPARILVLSLPEYLQKFGLYIDTIKEVYNNEQSIAVDFVNKQVILGGRAYSPDFTTH